MRGKVAEAVGVTQAYRITPAHAGKRALGDADKAGKRDHPRPCGEKLEQAEALHQTQGSPPPMRGKGQPNVARGKHHGITPAHAGKRTR